MRPNVSKELDFIHYLSDTKIRCYVMCSNTTAVIMTSLLLRCYLSRPYSDNNFFKYISIRVPHGPQNKITFLKLFGRINSKKFHTN